MRALFFGLSIPFWSDFIDTCWFNEYRHHDKLSIPFWSDFINSGTRRRETWYSLSLSIPFWSDFIFAVIFKVTEPINDFQSHFGLILSDFIFELKTPSRDELSIPFWSDFIRLYLKSTGKKEGHFQSHFGLILSFATCTCTVPSHRYFQSHFGLILSVVSIGGDVEEPKAFNPILVWFYPKNTKYAFFTCFAFQSHFGLILSN